MREQLTVAISDNPQFKFLLVQLGRLVSHLESEREKRLVATTMSAHHQDVIYGDPDDPNKPGLLVKVNTMWKWRSGILSLGSCSVGILLTLIFKHFFP